MKVQVQAQQSEIRVSITIVSVHEEYAVYTNCLQVFETELASLVLAHLIYLSLIV